MPLVCITRLRVRPRPAAVAGRRSILACLGLLAALAGPPAWAQTWPSPADLRDLRMRQSSMRGPAATAHHRATGSARRRSKILSPPHNFARSLGRQKLVTPARLGSRCASGSRNSMLRGGLVRRDGGREPRVPISSYSTPMLGRRCLTSWPSGGPRRCRRGLASALPFRISEVLERAVGDDAKEPN